MPAYAAGCHAVVGLSLTQEHHTAAGIPTPARLRSALTLDPRGAHPGDAARWSLETDRGLGGHLPTSAPDSFPTARGQVVPRSAVEIAVCIRDKPLRRRSAQDNARYGVLRQAPVQTSTARLQAVQRGPCRFTVSASRNFHARLSGRAGKMSTTTWCWGARCFTYVSLWTEILVCHRFGARHLTRLPATSAENRGARLVPGATPHLHAPCTPTTTRTQPGGRAMHRQAGLHHHHQTQLSRRRSGVPPERTILITHR